MLQKRNLWVALAGLMLISAVIPFVFAAEGDQTPPPPPGQGQGGFGGGQGGPGGPGGGQMRGQGQGRGGMDFQARMMEMAKTELAASEESWKKIEPLLTKVFTLNNEINSRGMMRGRQGRPDQPAEGAQSELQKATVALRAMTQDDTASLDTIKAKLAELRAAKEKAKAELTKAQEELKKNLDARQEAKLVLMGMLN